MIKDRYEEAKYTFDKNAQNYQDRFMDMDLYHDTFDLFCDLIKKADPKILEIACGPGNISKYLLSKLPDSKLMGIDFAPSMIKLARENNPNADFEVMDARNLDHLKVKFDAIMCGFCLPYLTKEDCIKLIRDCSNLINAKGILYLSTMEGEYSSSSYETASNGIDKCFVHYHQEVYLREMLNENGFKVLNVIRRKFPKPDGTFAIDMIIISKVN